MFWGIPGWALGVAVIILASSLGRAFIPAMRGRFSRFDRQGLPDADTTRLSEAVDDLPKRPGGIGGRLDFAERMIAQPRDRQGRGPPQRSDKHPGAPSPGASQAGPRLVTLG